MKKGLYIIALITMALAFSSCQKTKYCQCFAFVDNEDVQLGEDYYMMEHGTCNDKAKEIVGWPQVTCKEITFEEEEGPWYERLFNTLFNHNSNNQNSSNQNTH